MRVAALESNGVAGAEVHANLDQVTRILINLFQNAAQAMPEGGELSLAASISPNEICLVVRDSGSGIPPEHLDLIFEPLFSTKVRGVGLGLSIAKRYAELNEGTLSVESEPNRGTAFRLVLPRPSAGAPQLGS